MESKDSLTDLLAKANKFNGLMADKVEKSLESIDRMATLNEGSVSIIESVKSSASQALDKTKASVKKIEDASKKSKSIALSLRAVTKS